MSGLEEFHQRVHALYTQAREGNWAHKSRAEIVHEMERVLPEVQTLEKHVIHLQNQLLTKENVPGLAEYVRELGQLEKFLERNIGMEKNKTESDFSAINVMETLEHGEHHSSIQRKLIAAGLKGKFLLQELPVSKERGKSEMHKAGSTLQDLLDERETQLLELQKKYRELNYKSFMGLVQEKTLAELENALAEKRSALEREMAVLGEKFNEYTLENLRLQKQLLELKRDKGKMEFLLDKFLDQEREVILTLKKERDYAKQVLSESAPENLQLHKKYSKQLMKLEKEKHVLRKEFQDKFGNALKTVKHDLEEKERLLKYFQDLTAKQETQTLQEHEKVKELKLVLAMKDKHEKVLRQKLRHYTERLEQEQEQESKED